MDISSAKNEDLMIEKEISVDWTFALMLEKDTPFKNSLIDRTVQIEINSRNLMSEKIILKLATKDQDDLDFSIRNINKMLKK
jgi:hypothetical protein